MVYKHETGVVYKDNPSRNYPNARLVPFVAGEPIHTEPVKPVVKPKPRPKTKKPRQTVDPYMREMERYIFCMNYTPQDNCERPKK